MSDHFHIIFAPLVPVIWLYLSASIVIAVCVFAYHRHARGSFIRFVLFALLLLALANPSLVGEKREPLKDTALVVVDDSASMKLGDRAPQAKHAADAVQNKLANFSDLDVETLHVNGESETDLFTAIEQKRSQLPADRVAGVIMITDGQIHDAPPSNKDALLHALIVGRKGEVDRRIVIKSAPSYGMVASQAIVTLRVEDEPKPASANATITITRDDATVQTLNLPVGQDVQVKAAIGHAGANTLAFAVDPLPNELTPINNVATATINGIRDRLRVLLVSGEPHAGGRNWRNLLKADPAVDLVHFTILRSPFKNNAVPNKELSLIAFPSKEIFDTKLKDFDLVIFDGFSNRTLIPDTYLANIARYVEQGGALLITNATGAQAAELSLSPLMSILPTKPSGGLLTGSFVPSVTEAGTRHPVTATLTSIQNPNQWGPWYRQVDAEIKNSNAEILLAGQNKKPLLILQHVGKGRVAQFLSNQFWLWARQYPNGGPQAELLRRTAHWLVQEPELDEAALRAEAEHTDDGWRIRISKRSLHDNEARIVLTGNDDQPIQVKLTTNDNSGVLRASVPVKQAGLYHVKDDRQEILVMAGASDAPEFSAMVATDKIVTAPVKNSGGAVVWLADKADGPDIRRTDKDGAQSGWGWIGLKKNGQYRVVGSHAVPLWPAWLALGLLLVTAMLVWRREGRD